MGRCTCTCSRAIYSSLLVYQNTFINEICAGAKGKEIVIPKHCLARCSFCQASLLLDDKFSAWHM